MALSVGEALKPAVLPVRNSAGSSKVVVVKKPSGDRGGGKLLSRQKIPDEILNDGALNAAIALLPRNYNFEIHKTIWRILSDKPALVALQFPEGLLMYACTIADILSAYAGGVKVLVLGDVTYGACCIDDFTAQKLGAEMLVHYGHSCLVPVNVTRIKVMYVFVEIFFECSHLVACIRDAFAKDTKIALMGTIQFTSVLHEASLTLLQEYPNCVIPQAKPLSGGETLGCTSPLLEDVDVLVFVADGRFHLEAAMIRNPIVAAYRYDPYSKVLSHERYDLEKMKQVRQAAITKAATANTFGLIMGTLGRQGSPLVFANLQRLLIERGKRVLPFLMAEINPVKLALVPQVQVWVQVACPRLSIDWANGFDKPILTPYELHVAIGETAWQETYPMDFYSQDGGSWSIGGQNTALAAKNKSLLQQKR